MVELNVGSGRNVKFGSSIGGLKVEMTLAWNASRLWHCSKLITRVGPSSPIHGCEDATAVPEAAENGNRARTFCQIEIFIAESGR